MSDHPLINLLIVDRSPSDSERIVQTLRDAGYIIQPQQSDNEREIQDIIQYKPVDLIIARQGENLPMVGALRSQLDSAGKDIPLLVAIDDETQQSPLELLRTGADNLFPLNDPEHLLITAKKELHHLSLRQQAHSLETRLKETELRNRSLLDNATDGIAYIHEGLHIYANRTYLSLFGYESADELASMTLMDMVETTDRDQLKRFLRSNTKAGEPLDPIELSGVHRDGTVIPICLGCTPTRIDEEPCLQILIQKPAQPQNLHQRLDELSTQDSYTGLYNRKYFTQYLDEISANPDKSGGAVLYILLTDYRSISERLGLEAIDQLVADLASLLRKLVANDDTVARFSDAVFSVYTPLSSRKSVMQLGERICNGIKDHVSHAAQKLITTSSATGICLIQDTHESAYEILGHADRACETARKMGPNNVQVYTARTEKTDAEKREEELVELIRDAISGERLTMLYQPIASFQGGVDERYKIQLQILDKNREPLAMSILEPVAERRGLMFALDKWVIMRGLEKLTERYRLGKTPPTLFVPLSSNSVIEGDFSEWLGQRLKETGLTGDFLVIEVKEEDAERFFKQSKVLRDKVQDLKCRFALSHFGGKENSERILQHVRPDFIKIDSALIEKLSKARDTATRESMAALTEKAQAMETKVVAEGISSAPQMASIWQYGVTLVQGDMVQEPGSDMDFDFQMFAG